MLKYYKVLCCVLLAFFSKAWASVTVSDTAYLPENITRLSLNNRLGFLVDSAKVLDLHQILSPSVQNKFQQHNSASIANFGFTSQTYWFKLVLKNEQRKQRKLLEIPYPFLNELIVYISNAQGGFDTIAVGDHFPFSHRKYQSKNFLFDLNLDAQETKLIYARIQCDGEATSFPVNVIDPAQLSVDASDEHLLLGFYYGIVVFALFLSIFLGASLKESINYRYFFYVLSVGLFQFSIDGLAFQYFWPNSVWLANHIIPIAGSAGLFFLIKFTQFLLLTQKHLPRFCKYLNVLATIVFLLFIAAFLNNPFFSFSLKALNFMALVVNLSILIAAIKVNRLGFRPSRYFLIAFLLLLIGTTLQMLKNFDILPRVFLTEYGIQLGSGIEIIFLSFALSERVRVLKDEKQAAQDLLLSQLKENNRLQKEMNIELEQKVQQRTIEIKQQKELVETQKKLIEEKHKEITDSINYAERIQRSFLATKAVLNSNLENYFVFFQPKDIVSGDFYWATELQDGNFALAVADSTGHGVPGAIMSILNISSLELAIREQLLEPAEILNYTRTAIIERLSKDGSIDGGKDGMDTSLIVLDKNKQRLQYAAANNPVWIVRNGQLIELAADKMPVGKHERDTTAFSQHTVDLQADDMLYLFTDGYADQFGGPKGKKFLYSRLKSLLTLIAALPLSEQEQKIRAEFFNWKGQLDQTDDVVVFGLRIPSPVT